MNRWSTETVSVLNCSTFRAGSERKERREGESAEKGNEERSTRNETRRLTPTPPSNLTPTHLPNKPLSSTSSIHLRTSQRRHHSRTRPSTRHRLRTLLSRVSQRSSRSSDQPSNPLSFSFPLEVLLLLASPPGKRRDRGRSGYDGEGMSRRVSGGSMLMRRVLGESFSFLRGVGRSGGSGFELGSVRR